MDKMVIGNNNIKVSEKISEIISFIELKKLTNSVYTLCKGSLMVVEFVYGRRIRVKLFNSLNVNDEIRSITNVEVINV